MRHTPGPWIWEISPGMKLDYVLSGDPAAVDVICTLGLDNPANARLIAAVPDLLAACVEFVRKVECGEARSKRSYAQMKAAIAKATGE